MSDVNCSRQAGALSIKAEQIVCDALMEFMGMRVDDYTQPLMLWDARLYAREIIKRLSSQHAENWSTK
jgi:hypothetical protein